MTATILPELGASFGITADEAAAAIVAYLLPFSSLMLFSGRWGQRWGPRRTVIGAYLVTVVAALGCAVAPWWGLFIACFAVAGAANAFTTPLLLAMLGATTPAARLGAALGIQGAMQGLGQLSAPLLAGLIAQVSWHYLFVAVAAVALLLACVGLPAVDKPTSAPLRGWKWMFGPSVRRFAPIYFLLGSCVTGLAFLIATRAEDGFGSSAPERGLIVMCGGASALVIATLAGRLVDRLGPQRVETLGLLGAGAALVLCALAPHPIVLAVAWGMTTSFGQTVLISANAQVLQAPGASSTISIMQSMRFFGSAAAPIILIPVYRATAAATFAVPAVLCVGVAGLLWLVRRRA